jgi:hypothetical protein
LIGRARRPVSDAELDEHLAGIFDDRLMPGAPQALYAYVREIPMTTPTEPGFGRARNVWRALGRSGRTAVSLATALVVAAGAVAVIAGMPRGGIPGAGAGSSSLEPIP